MRLLEVGPVSFLGGGGLCQQTPERSSSSVGRRTEYIDFLGGPEAEATNDGACVHPFVQTAQQPLRAAGKPGRTVPTVAPVRESQVKMQEAMKDICVKYVFLRNEE